MTENKFPVVGEELTEAPSDGFDPTPLFVKKNSDENVSGIKDAVMAVFDTLDMNVKSVLDNKHIIALVRGRIFADRYNSAITSLLCQQLLEMRVSLKGRGRKDMVTALEASMHRVIDADLEKRKASRLFGTG